METKNDLLDNSSDSNKLVDIISEAFDKGLKEELIHYDLSPANIQRQIPTMRNSDIGAHLFDFDRHMSIKPSTPDDPLALYKRPTLDIM